MGIGRSQWAFEGSPPPQTLASVGLLGAGHATPTLLLLFPSYCYCLDLRALLFCDTLLPWTPGHPDPAVVQRCPGPHLPSLLPGPLVLSGFTICLVRSTWPRQGCPWGQLSPSPNPPSGITLRASVSESDLEASFYSFLSPGRDLSSLGCGCRSQTDGSSPEAPRRAAATCFLSMWFVVYSYSLRMCVWGRGRVAWGLITRTNCLGSKSSSATH